MIVHQFTDPIRFSLSLGSEKMFLIPYIFRVFNIIQQLVSSSIPLPYAYYQLRGGKKNIAQVDQISKCMHFLSRREKKFKPKDPGKIIWKIEHLDCLDSS